MFEPLMVAKNFTYTFKLIQKLLILQNSLIYHFVDLNELILNIYTFKFNIPFGKYQKISCFLGFYQSMLNFH